MITFNSHIFEVWVIALMLPLTRILGFIAIAPFFSTTSFTIPVKVAFGVMLALIVIPAVPEIPRIDILSFQGILIVAEQVIIGLAMGLTAQIIFTGVEMAGQLSGLMMGFGFASFFDPQSQTNTPAIGTMMNILAMMVFLSINGHLILVSGLLESFRTFPIGVEAHGIDMMRIALWGSKIFSIGLQLALPMVAALLITNIALGILTRAAPQLNIFGIGFPITICVGFIVFALMMPSMAPAYRYFIEQGIATSQSIIQLR
ncbi:flagellar biosynthetic protein FliR [Polynucleobacter paneuropaeus]|nr:flagellar biosynthetic protein FliR [Polynucleobacter paneuropaeus]